MEATQTNIKIKTGKIKDVKKIEDLVRFTSFDLDRILITMMKDDPFFCHVSRYIRKLETSIIPTAAVSYANNEFVMYWNPVFFSLLTENSIKGIIKHELYHIILDHITTRRRDNKVLWNIATDLAINSLLVHSGTELPEGCLIPGQKFVIPHDRKLKEEEQNAQKFATFIEKMPHLKTSDWYYEQISRFMEENGLDIPSAFTSIDDHSGWENIPENQKEYVKGRIRRAVGDAVKKADQNNQWGSIPAAIREKLRELYSNEIDWKALLRQFCGTSRSFSSTHSIKKINRKYPYIHPGIKRNYTANIGVFIDQSGSVGNDEISMFFGELSSLAKKIDFTVYFFDTDVDEENKIKWRRGQKVSPKRTRCGGTDFQAVINYVNKHQSEYDGILILTDGACYQPTPSKIKLAWVICPSGKLNFVPRASEVHIQMKNSINNSDND